MHAGVQLSTFRRYAVPTGVQLLTFRLYAVLTGTVIDVSALRSVNWYSYRRYAVRAGKVIDVTPCLLVVVDVSALSRACW